LGRVGLVARAVEEGAEKKTRRAGADIVFSPYSIAGHRLAHALIRPHEAQLLDFQAVGLDVTMEQLRLSQDPAVPARKLGELAPPQPGLIVLAIGKPDGRMVFNPPVDTVVSGGDVLIAMGEQPNLRKLENILTNSRSS
jgi:voltage-gated potassium channel